MGLGSAVTNSYVIIWCWCCCCSLIFIARTIQTGQGGICGCMARLFRGIRTGRADLLGTLQRHGSHRLLLLCRSIVQFLRSAPARGQMNYHLDTADAAARGPKAAAGSGSPSWHNTSSRS